MDCTGENRQFKSACHFQILASMVALHSEYKSVYSFVIYIYLCKKHERNNYMPLSHLLCTDNITFYSYMAQTILNVSLILLYHRPLVPDLIRNLSKQQSFTS